MRGSHLKMRHLQEILKSVKIYLGHFSATFSIKKWAFLTGSLKAR